MNETVKAALLDQRRVAVAYLARCATEAHNAHQRLRNAESERDNAMGRVEDLEAFLRDNGVDLASVDAEAEKARTKSGGLSTNLAQGYGQPLIDQVNLGQGYANGLGQNANNTLGARNTFDPTAGLAKALSEA